MLIGLIEQLAGRDGFNGRLMIRFRRDKGDFAMGTVLSTNSGALQFYVPLETVLSKPEEKVEFHLELPFHGATTLVGKLCKYRIGVDNEQHRIAYYEARFINIARDVWNDLVDYVQFREERKNQTAVKGLAVQWVNENRLDFRVHVDAVKIEIKPVKGKLIRGVLEDLSIGGARAFIPQELAVGTKATFRIRRKDYQMLMNVECARIEPDGENGFLAGLRFEGVSKEQFERLRDMIFQMAGSGQPV